jgi:hypothetical protein
MSAQPLIRLSLIDSAEWCWAAVCDSGTGCVEGPSRCRDRCILTCARAFYRRSMIVCRAGRPRPGVSASSAIRWAALRRAGGEGPAKPQGGDRSSRCTEAHADLIRAALAEMPDLTLEELKACLADRGGAGSAPRHPTQPEQKIL